MIQMPEWEIKGLASGLDIKFIERETCDEDSPHLITYVESQNSSTAKSGSGLGLAIANDFARIIGGKIEVDSQLGRGSSFLLETVVRSHKPQTHNSQMGQMGRVIRVASSRHRYRILVVEDRIESRDLLKQLLTSVGFATQTANNGKEAVAIWQRWQPELILMDMRMPVMDGYEATQRIREHQKNNSTKFASSTKIIALTASVFQEDRDAVLAAGCDDLLCKPFKEEEIFAQLTKHLGVSFLRDRPTSQREQNLNSSISWHESINSPEMATTSLDILALPEELILNLNQAAVNLDLKSLEQTITQIRLINPALADKIAVLIAEYRFAELQRLLG